MEIRSENLGQSSDDRTLKDLTPNVAALLCYVGGWISGIVFLVLEQKNRYVRFHAIQSIAVFGVLTLAGAILGSIPAIGIGFRWAIWITGFIFWIILMVKASNGEYYKMPWAGNFAERLTADSLQQTMPQPVKTQDHAGPTGEQPASIPVAQSTRRNEFRAKYYSMGARTGRIAGSAFAIAWSVALLIFFNFFNQYIAYYQPVEIGNITQWQMHTLVTSSFYLWLPLLTATLILSIVGHALLIAFDKYVLRQAVEIVLAILGITTVINLLVIFPFDFSVITNADVAFWAAFGLSATFVIIAVGMAIGILVRLIQTVVNVAESKY
jgi:uncharacterized membrane protein